MGEDTIDGFAGPGGWDLAARQLGLDPLGIEIDDAACATREAAGLRTLQADVSQLDPLEFAPCRRAIFSPPCPSFSMAGRGQGRDAMPLYRDAMVRMAFEGKSVDRGELDAMCSDPRAHLILEPLRFVLALRPRWVACEQVEPCLPLWETMAECLRHVGYRTWTGVLSAERYGSVATCPVHDRRPAPNAASRLSLADLATADPAGTGWAELTESAENARRRSIYLTDLGSVHAVVTGSAITERATAALSDAWDAALLARVALDAATDATWRERVRCLLSRALPARRIPRGRVAAMWEAAGTFESGWVADTGESIGWSPSDFWAALCSAARSFTTSMRTGETTRPRTSGSSEITPPTCSTTGAAISRADCSLCDDYATPQTRKRAILMGSLDRQPCEPPASHARYVPPRVKAKQDESLFAAPEPERIVLPEDRELLPWVSMAEALGWGMTARPYPVLACSSETGGPDLEKVGGSGARAAVYEEQAAGRWAGTFEPNGQRTDRGRGRPDGEWVPEEVPGGVRFRATNERPNAAERDASAPAPAPALAFGHNVPSWVTDTGNTKGGARPDGLSRSVDAPAPTITSRADQLERRSEAALSPCGCLWEWVDADGFCACCQAHLDDPAGFYAVQGDGSHGMPRCPSAAPTHYDSRQQKDGRTREPNRRRGVSEPAPTIAGESRNDSWVSERPATTVAGDPRVFPPGHKVNEDDLRAGRGGQRRSGAGSSNGAGVPEGQGAVRVQVSEAAVLQGFPPDYPWQGTRTAQYRQVGDLVPPPLARAVIEGLL